MVVDRKYISSLRCRSPQACQDPFFQPFNLIQNHEFFCLLNTKLTLRCLSHKCTIRQTLKISLPPALALVRICRRRNPCRTPMVAETASTVCVRPLMISPAILLLLFPEGHRRWHWDQNRRTMRRYILQACCRLSTPRPHPSTFPMDQEINLSMVKRFGSAASAVLDLGY